MKRALMLALAALVVSAQPTTPAAASATSTKTDRGTANPYEDFADGWAAADASHLRASMQRPDDGSGYQAAATCFESDHPDPAYDVEVIDVAHYGFTYDCAGRSWVFGLLTYDGWNADELDYLFVELDTDHNAGTGCEGNDYVVVAGYDNGLYAGILQLPDCSSSSWVDRGAAYIDRAGSVDFLGIAFDHAQIGDPSSFRYRASLESVYSYTVERMPNAGSHSESGWQTSSPGPAPAPSPSPEPAPSSGSGNGYWLFAVDGGMFSFGDAPFYGSLGDGRCTEVDPPTWEPGTYQTCSDMAVTPSGNGYWLVDWNCTVTAFGDAVDYGDAWQGQGPAWEYDSWGQCYIEPTPTGRGYWLANSFGGVKGLGDAAFYGGTDADLPDDGLVDIKSTATGRGYWLVDSRGAIRTYGDAAFHGSAANLSLNGGVVSMATTPKRDGYWLVGTDGGIFAYGAARFFGSTGNTPLNLPVWGMAATPTGNGYWLFALDGGIFTFGDARFMGSTGDMQLNAPIIGMGVR